MEAEYKVKRIPSLQGGKKKKGRKKDNKGKVKTQVLSPAKQKNPFILMRTSP